MLPGFLCQVRGYLAVRVRPAMFAVRAQDRPSGRRGLGEANRLRERWTQHVKVIGRRDRVEHGASMVGAPVVQRGKHAPNLETFVGEPPDVVHGVEKLTHTAVRKRLALQRNEYGVRGGQCGDGEDPERWRAVEQDP